MILLECILVECIFHGKGDVVAEAIRSDGIPVAECVFFSSRILAGYQYSQTQFWFLCACIVLSEFSAHLGRAFIMPHFLYFPLIYWDDIQAAKYNLGL